MAASIITSARAPEAEQPTTPLNEPSMEDILASIRRIIAEDQSQGLARNGLTGLTRRSQPPEAPAEAKLPAPPMEDAPSAEPSFVAEQEAELHGSPQADVIGAVYESGTDAPEQAEAHPEVFPVMEAEAYHAAPHDDTALEDVPQGFDLHRHEAIVPQEAEAEPLMSPTAGASITSSFQALAESVVLQDPGLVERIMRESMRPLLKEWLDDHLPSIVERLVRAEIERVARGGRSRD